MRKEFYGILPLALTSCLASQATAQEKQTQRPNVVFIYADDIGYGDLSCNGAKTIHTPNVERLAKMGVRFTNAHSAAATSTPSRYAMLTGEYAWRKAGTGIAAGDAAAIIRPERYTMANLFKDAGYNTGVVGKWHLGLGDKGGEQDWNKPLQPGTNDIGFEYSFIMAATGDRVPCVFVENDQVINLDPNDPIQVSYKANFPGEPTGKENPELLRMHPSVGHSGAIVNGVPRIGFQTGGKAAQWRDEDMAELFLEKAKMFMRENKDKPFFLYYGLHQPHVPRVPNERFVGKSGMGPRGDVILEADWCISDFLKEMDRLGLTENTLVVFTSDNGPVLDDGYKDNAKELIGSHKPAGPYKGWKCSMYEGGTCVPFLIRWPAVVEPGVSDALICQIDLLASLSALVGQTYTERTDSQNTLSVFLGKSKEGRQELVIEGMHNYAFRQGDWVMIPPYRPGKAYELYNVKLDPEQTMDKSKENPTLLRNMMRRLEYLKRATGKLTND